MVQALEEELARATVPLDAIEEDASMDGEEKGEAEEGEEEEGEEEGE